MSVWNSPGSCVMLADGKSKARTSTSVTQVNSAVFESRFQIHILYLQSELVCHRLVRTSHMDQPLVLMVKIYVNLSLQLNSACV